MLLLPPMLPSREEVLPGRRKLWDPSSEERWGHDKFEALERGDDVYDDEETLAVSVTGLCRSAWALRLL